MSQMQLAFLQSGAQRTASDASQASLASQGSGTIPTQAPASNSSLEMPKEDNSHSVYNDRAAAVASKVAAAASAAAVSASAGSAIPGFSPLAPDAEPGNLEALQKRLRSLNQASLQQQA
jgi:hypothetical protein